LFAPAVFASHLKDIYRRIFEVSSGSPGLPA